MPKRDSKGRFVKGNDDPGWELPISSSSLKKALLLLLLLILFISYKTEIFDAISELKDLIGPKKVKKAGCAQVAFSIYDDYNGKKSVDAMEWKEQYDIYAKERNKRKAKEFVAFKSNLHDSAIEKAYDKILEEKAAQYATKIKEKEPNLLKVEEGDLSRFVPRNST